MKLEKAIEIITLMGTPDFEGHTEDILAARKLLIEAGKEILSLRQIHAHDMTTRLPGETEESCKFCGLAHTGIECPSREGEK